MLTHLPVIILAGAWALESIGDTLCPVCLVEGGLRSVRAPDIWVTAYMGHVPPFPLQTQNLLTGKHILKCAFW